MALVDCIAMNDTDQPNPAIDVGMVVIPKDPSVKLSVPAHMESIVHKHYGHAIVVAVAPSLILVSEFGEMRWQNEIAANFVAVAKARASVMAVANTRLAS